jgi:hypothetical protein
MAIELSNLTFTEQDDVVPQSGEEQIVNTGIANTLAGKDIITGTAIQGIGTPDINSVVDGLYNSGTLNTNDGNDIIIGICREAEGNFNELVNYTGISNQSGIIDTGNGNDTIIGTDNIPPYTDNGGSTAFSLGFFTYFGTVDTGNGDDIIIGTGQTTGFISGYSTVDTGNGDDIIMGTSQNTGFYVDYGTLDTGNGNDMITGTGRYVGISNNLDTFNTAAGNDTIIGNGIEGVGISTGYHLDTGDGNDIITGISTEGRYGIVNNSRGNPSDVFPTSIIDTGEGDDIITGIGSIGIYNHLGIINTGNGQDSIIADGGFDGAGNVFLENGKDYLKGFGSGNFNGGNGQDTLELTSGSYAVGISGTAVNFIKDSIIMNTSEFEKLKAGSTIYDFTSLTAGQIIVVA